MYCGRIYTREQPELDGEIGFARGGLLIVCLLSKYASIQRDWRDWSSPFHLLLFCFYSSPIFWVQFPIQRVSSNDSFHYLHSLAPFIMIVSWSVLTFPFRRLVIFPLSHFTSHNLLYQQPFLYIESEEKASWTPNRVLKEPGISDPCSILHGNFILFNLSDSVASVLNSDPGVRTATKPEVDELRKNSCRPWQF